MDKSVLKAIKRLILCTFGIGYILAQQPSREYIRLGDRVIAIENPTVLITVTSAGGVTSVGAGDTLQFSATVTPSNQGQISWASTEGSISAAGLYSPVVTTASQHTVGITASIPGVATSAQFALSVVPILTPLSANLPSNATSNNTISLTKAGTWQASSNNSWLHITSAASGSGNSTVTYSVDQNLGTTQRVGTLTIASATFTVSQDPSGGFVNVTPPVVTVSGTGGLGNQSVVVNTGGSVSWNVSSVSSWIQVDPTLYQTQTGDRTFSFTASANPSSVQRTDGQIVISASTGQVTVQVTQYGGITLNPASASAPSGGIQTTPFPTVQVIAPTGSPWSSDPPPQGITIQSGASGPAGATTTLSYSVAPNPSSSPRSLSWYIGGKLFTVNQAGTTSFTISPSFVQLFSAQSQNFQALLSGVAQSASWSINPSTGAGTIDSSGHYTSPLNISSPQFVTVTATYLTYTAHATIYLYGSSYPNGIILYPTNSNGVEIADYTFVLDVGYWNGHNETNWEPIELLITNNADGAFPSPQNSCDLQWDLANLSYVPVRLENDTGNGFSSSVLATYNTQTMQNSQCGWDLAKSTITTAPGNQAVRLTFRLLFNPQWKGTKQIYLRAFDIYGATTVAPVQMGYWMVPDFAPPVIGFAGNTPANATTLPAGTVSIQGYAFDNLSAAERAISSVEAFVDNIKIGNATLGDTAPAGTPNTCITRPQIPGCPNVGFHYAWDTTTATNGTHTFKVVATDADPTPHVTSVERSFVVSNGPPPVSAPTFSPTAGTYTSTQTVTVSTATTGASIRYTVDGTTPTSSTGLLYSGSVVVANTLTLKAIAYKAGMSDSQVTSGAYTITNGPLNQPPTNVSVTPSSGSGATQTFSFVASSPNGYTYISSVNMIINWWTSGINGCYVLYNRTSNLVYLANDQFTVWLGGVAPGTAGTLSNSQCQVNTGGVTVSGSGNNLTVNVPITFASSFVGPQQSLMTVSDNGGLSSNWQQMGTWTGYAASSMLPSVTSVTPNSGSGMNQVFQYVISDVNGYKYVGRADILIQSSVNGAGACYFWYYPNENSIWLWGDSGSAWAGNTNLGASTTIENSQCRLNAATSSVSGSGNTLTVNLSLTFKTAFSGAKNNYVGLSDRGGGYTGFVQSGTWTVQ